MSEAFSVYVYIMFILGCEPIILHQVLKAQKKSWGRPITTRP